MATFLKSIFAAPPEEGIDRLWCVQCAKVVVRTRSAGKVSGHRYPACPGIVLDYPPGSDLSEVLSFTPADLSELNDWLALVQPELTEQEWFDLHEKLARQT